MRGVKRVPDRVILVACEWGTGGDVMVWSVLESEFVTNLENEINGQRLIVQEKCVLRGKNPKNE